MIKKSHSIQISHCARFTFRKIQHYIFATVIELICK